MLFSRVLLFVILMLPLSSGTASAAVISVHYTGTYTGWWNGNYDPLGPANADPGYGSGTYSVTPFDLLFVFDTAIAIPGFFTSSHLANPPGNYLFDPYFPSVGQAVFTSDPFSLSSGYSYASLDATLGITTQFAAAQYNPRDSGQFISISATSPLIPSSILENYRYWMD
jgi:hypothetical protein